MTGVRTQKPLPTLVRLALVALTAVISVWLAIIAVPRNLDKACEAAEWPNLTTCIPPSTDPAQQVLALRERAARNPGDATSYLALAVLAVQPAGIAPLNADAVLATASQLAGENPMLRRVLASRALELGQWPQAVALLARLAHDDRDPVAAQRLASLLTQTESRDAVLQALKPDSQWVTTVMAALPAAKVPIADALPFLSKALALGLIPSEQGLAMVSQLKAAGQWLAAQALWLRLLGQPAPLIYNGGFEQGFLRGGFDWELPELPESRGGVSVRQPVVEGANGRALALAFNGRPLATPVISQTLVLFPGNYQFSSRFSSRQLRAGGGLVWTLTCLPGTAELARSSAITDTANRWLDVSFAVEVPQACGAVQLRLQTLLASDALSGLSGEAFVDDVQLRVR